MKAPVFCPICKFKKVIPFKISRYWFCEECKTAWMMQFPKIDYSENYYKAGSNIAAALFSPIAYGLYLLRSCYVGFGKKDLWIDVGAGDGGFLKTVNAHRKIGVEISVSGRKIMKKIGMETMTEKEFLKNNKLKAEIISFWHVLEHVEQPWLFLNAAKKNLSSKGRVVVGIPNIDSFEFTFFGKGWFHLQYPFHLWHFSTNSIVLLLKNYGFKIEKIDHWAPEHHLAGVLQSFINRFASTENVLQKIIKRRTHRFSLSIQDIFWSFFWLTLGFPFIFFFWITGSLLHKSGTIVIVAAIK